MIKYINSLNNSFTWNTKLLLLLLELENNCFEKFYFLIPKTGRGLVGMEGEVWEQEPWAETHFLHHLLPLSVSYKARSYSYHNYATISDSWTEFPERHK